MDTYFVPPSVPGDAPSAVGHSSLGATGMYLPGWSLAPGSLLSEQDLAVDGANMHFPPATMDAFDALSYYHMANDLQYVVAQVSPYLVAVVGRLRYIRANWRWLLLNPGVTSLRRRFGFSKRSDASLMSATS